VKFIKLTQGKSTMVDDSDYEFLKKYRWFAMKSKKTFYAVRYRPGGGNILMHREIMCPPINLVIDHINHNGLDNRRVNLRVANCVGNSCNSRPTTGESSQYKGVSWYAYNRKWCVQVVAGGRRYYLGLFKDEIEAALAYDRAAVELHGEFACLNFPFLW